jgi:hypothetical protein
MPQAAGESFFHAFPPLSDENGGINGADCIIPFRALLRARATMNRCNSYIHFLLRSREKLPIFSP